MAFLPRPVMVVLATLLTLGGCRDNANDTLDVMVIGDAAPAIADPSDGPLTAAQQVLMLNVAQGLVRFDARGQIEPGLAERWNVSDDGLSYVFRLSAGNWPDGRSIQARDVARLLTRTLRSASRNPAKDMLGAVEEVVAMTDRVIEIRLSAPRPNLLQLLAQPELGLTREGLGTGPFQPVERTKTRGAIALLYVAQVIDRPDKRDLVDLTAASAARAIAAFVGGQADFVLGGTFDDLPLVRRAKIARSAVRFDPVAGLFGLVPARRGGPLADQELRGLLNRAIDREALVAALAVPGLAPRATLLQSGLEGLAPPAQPGWALAPIVETLVLPVSVTPVAALAKIPRLLSPVVETVPLIARVTGPVDAKARIASLPGPVVVTLPPVIDTVGVNSGPKNKAPWGTRIPTELAPAVVTEP